MSGWLAATLGRCDVLVNNAAVDYDIVWAALLSDDGPTGGFFRDGLPLPW